MGELPNCSNVVLQLLKLCSIFGNFKTMPLNDLMLLPSTSRRCIASTISDSNFDPGTQCFSKFPFAIAPPIFFSLPTVLVSWMSNIKKKNGFLRLSLWRFLWQHQLKKSFFKYKKLTTAYEISENRKIGHSVLDQQRISSSLMLFLKKEPTQKLGTSKQTVTEVEGLYLWNHLGDCDEIPVLLFGF